MIENLPEEIHHEIFSYLDFVDDLCRYKKLMVPQFNLSEWTIQEFENKFKYNDDDEVIEISTDKFNVNFDKAPLFLTCKTFLRSFISFKPISLHIKIFGKITKSIFEIDFSKSLNRSDALGKQVSTEWVVWLTEFIEKVEKFTNSKFTFQNIEHVELWSCTAPFASRVDLNQLMVRNFPDIKVVNVNFSGVYNNILPNYRVVEFQYLRNMYVGPNLHTKFNSTRISVEELDRIFSPGYIRNVELYLLRAIEIQTQQVIDYILKRYKLNIEHFIYLCNVQRNTLFTSEKSLKNTLKALEVIHKEYPQFKIFTLSIHSLKCIQTIQKYAFIHVNISNNLTEEFVRSLYCDKKLKDTITEKYGIDLSEWDQVFSDKVIGNF